MNLQLAILRAKQNAKSLYWEHATVKSDIDGQYVTITGSVDGTYHPDIDSLVLTAVENVVIGECKQSDFQICYDSVKRYVQKNSGTWEECIIENHNIAAFESDELEKMRSASYHY